MLPVSTHDNHSRVRIQPKKLASGILLDKTEILRNTVTRSNLRLYCNPYFPPQHRGYTFCSRRDKESNYFSNVMIKALYVLMLLWWLHQEVVFEMCMLWISQLYYLPFLKAMFLIWGFNSFQHWFISNSFSKLINYLGSIALMKRASLIFFPVFYPDMRAPAI